MKFSIITVCRNAEATIERTLKSVVIQQGDGVEVEQIVIDAASTDGTVAIIEKYDAQLPLLWVSEPDGGIYDAMNKGLRMATGEVIAILNADDGYFPGTLQRVAEEFRKEKSSDLQKLDYLYGSVERWSGGKAVGTTRPLARELWEREIWWQMPLPHISLFVRRKIYEQVGEFDLSYRIGGDHDWVVRLFLSEARGVELPAPPLAYLELGGISGGWGRFSELYRCARSHGQPRIRTASRIAGYLFKQLLVQLLPPSFLEKLLRVRKGRF